MANFDSGCSHTLLSARDAVGRRKTAESGASSGIIVPAFGPATTSQGGVMIGPVKGTIVKDLHGTLVAAADLMDLGYTTILSEENPRLVNKELKKTIPLYYKDRTWWIDLHEVEDADLRTDLITKEIEDSWLYDAKTARRKQIILPLSTTRLDVLGNKSSRPFGKTIDLVIHIHKVMGHASESSMLKATQDNGCWKGTDITAEDIRKVFRVYECLICKLAKTNLKSPTLRISKPSTIPGNVIYVDFIPQSIPALDGSTLSILFSDEATGWLHIANVQRKSEIITALEHIYYYFTKYGWKISILRSDDEIVLKSMEVIAWLDERKIEKQESVPYQHWQCAVERDMQTVKKGVSALLHDQFLCGADMWGLCSEHWVNVRNHVPNVSTGSNCPIGLIEKKTIDLRHEFLFTFGQPLCVGIPKDKRTWNWDLKNDLGVYVGQPVGKVNGNLVYFPFTGQVLIRGSCTAVLASNDQLMRIWSIRNAIREKQLPWSELRNYWETVYEDKIADRFLTTTTSDQACEGVSAIDNIVTDYEGDRDDFVAIKTPVTTTPMNTVVPERRMKILRRLVEPKRSIRLKYKSEEPVVGTITRSRGRTNRNDNKMKFSRGKIENLRYLRSAKPVYWTSDEERVAERDANNYITDVLRNVVGPNGLPINIEPNITTTYQETFESDMKDYTDVPPERDRGSEYRGKGYVQRGDMEEVWSASDQFYYGGISNAVKLIRGPNNPTTKTALDLSKPDYAGWQEACKVEIEQLIGGEDPTLIACDRRDINKYGKGYEIFRTATAWVRKMDPSNPDIELRKKCRICADTSAKRGFFDDTYSPTV